MHRCNALPCWRAMAVQMDSHLAGSLRQWLDSIAPLSHHCSPALAKAAGRATTNDTFVRPRQVFGALHRCGKHPFDQPESQLGVIVDRAGSFVHRSPALC